MAKTVATLEQDVEVNRFEIAKRGGVMYDASVYTGQGDVVDKANLIGVEFIVQDWKLNESNKYSEAVAENVLQPREFCSVTVLTAGGDTLIFNDGSKHQNSIRSVLERHERETGRRDGIWCRKGLRASDYKHKMSDGSETAARSYYFD